MFLMEPHFWLNPTSINKSPILSKLCFTKQTKPILGQTIPILHYIRETAAHKKIRLRNSMEDDDSRLNQESSSLPEDSNEKHHTSLESVPEISREKIGTFKKRKPKIMEDELIDVPAFLYNNISKVYLNFLYELTFSKIL